MAVTPQEPARVPSAASPKPEAVLAHLDALPTLPAVAVELLALTRDERAGARDLARLVGSDQALAARVLTVANSAALGGRGRIDSLDQAIVRMGFDLVRNIVLAVKVFECFPVERGRDAKRPFDRAEFWKHALAVGCAARRLATLATDLRVAPEAAFLAGLLHDLGKVALDAVFPKAYGRALQRAEATRGDIADCERAVLGVDHTNAGRQLAEHWNLPAALRDVVWLHHISVDALPSHIVKPGLIALVQLADTLAREQRIGQSGNYVFHHGSAYLAQHLGVSEDYLRRCIEALASDVAEHCALLGLDRESPETLYLRSLTRANAELSRLNTELVGNNRRLETSARFFRALTRFDAALGPKADLSAVAVNITDVARIALACQRVAAFVLHADRQRCELAWVSDDDARDTHNITQPTMPAMIDWLDELTQIGARHAVRIAPAGRSVLAPALAQLDLSDPWLLPITHQGDSVGGVVIDGERQRLQEIASADEQLGALLRSFGQAVERTNAHAAAQQLSDDLAESNRRLQQLQTELLRARTLSMMAEMATGAGHELNNPLAVISGRAQMLLDTVTDEQSRRLLTVIHEKAHECSHVVSELMDFARPRTPRFEPIPLAELLERAREDWLEESGLAPSQLAFENDWRHQGGPTPLLWADREQMRMVLNELLRNASLAVEQNGGQITIAWEVDASDPHTGQAAAGQSPPSGWISIRVRDTGCGMSPEVLQRAFDPFFSHRRAGRGRGLGLPRAYRIVEAHGGRIWIESRPDAGTTVHLVLPRAANNATN